MISITSNRGVPAYGIKTFLVDSIADITNLPTKNLTPGSRAFVTENSSSYILNSSRKWVKMNVGSGGGGGSDLPEEIIYEGGDISNNTPSNDDTIYDGDELN